MSRFDEGEYTRCCAVLEVATDVSLAEVKKAHGAMVTRWHPDVNDGSPVSNERTKEINGAWDYVCEHHVKYQTRLAVLSRGSVAADAERKQRDEAGQRQQQATQTRTQQNSQRQQQAEAARRREEQAQAARAQAEQERQERATAEQQRQAQRRADEERERRETLHQPDFATFLTAQELEDLRDRFLAERDSPTLSRNKRDNRWFAFVEEVLGTVQKGREREQESVRKREREREAKARQRELDMAEVARLRGEREARQKERDLAEAARLQEARRLEEQREAAQEKAEREREEQERLAQVEREQQLKAEQERLAHAECERVKQNEPERLAQVEHERQVKAEQKRESLYAEFVETEFTSFAFDRRSNDHAQLQVIFNRWWQSAVSYLGHDKKLEEWYRFLEICSSRTKEVQHERFDRRAELRSKQREELRQAEENARLAEEARRRGHLIQRLGVMLITPVEITLSDARSFLLVAKGNEKSDPTLALLQLKVLCKRLAYSIACIAEQIKVETVEQYERPTGGNGMAGGAAVGGLVGLVLGPLGSLAGAAVGGWLGSNVKSTETAERRVVRFEPNPKLAEKERLRELLVEVNSQIAKLNKT